MLNILYIITLFLFVDAGDNQTNSIRKLEPRIWGGTSKNSSSLFPFYVGLKMTHKKTSSGGTLISKYFVLTAAHCLVKLNKTDFSWKTTGQVVVHFGMSKYFSEENDPNSYTMTVDKAGIIPHSSYNSSTLYNDIGLVKLPREATLTPSVQVANLPSINNSIDNVVGLKLFSAGWGRMGDDKNKRPTELQYIETQIVDGNDCIHPTVMYFNNDLNICVNTANRSTCKGDSGGPYVIFAPQPILIGITSHSTIPVSKNLYNAKITCEAGLPQVSTRVSHYLNWIHNLTNISISNNENELL